MNNMLHFYLTFNPFFNQGNEPNFTQAHEFYDKLKGLISKDKSETLFWGKIIGKDRESNLKFENFQNVLSTNLESNISTHLYISDFQHLWVGKVKSVQKKLPKNSKTLDFYKDRNVEIWFEIEDFILLEHNHEETAGKLGELFIENEYNDLVMQGLSPFTTSLSYPCILQDIAEEQYFDEFDKDECSHLVLKDNPAISKNNSDELLKSLHTYVFPEDLYSKIPHAAKLEIESAEIDMIEQRHHNMQKIAFSYLRALEIILNDLICHHIKRKGQGENFYVDVSCAPPRLHLNPTKDHFITLKDFSKNFSVAHLMRFMERPATQSHLGFKKTFSEHKQFVRFMTKEFPVIVDDNNLIEIRNALAHGESDKLSTADAFAVRALILGRGTTGLITKLYTSFYKDKLQHHYQVCDFGKSNSSKTDSKKKAGVKLKLVA